MNKYFYFLILQLFIGGLNFEIQALSGDSRQLMREVAAREEEELVNLSTTRIPLPQSFSSENELNQWVTTEAAYQRQMDRSQLFRERYIVQMILQRTNQMLQQIHEWHKQKNLSAKKFRNFQNLQTEAFDQWGKWSSASNHFLEKNRRHDSQFDPKLMQQRMWAFDEFVELFKKFQQDYTKELDRQHPSKVCSSNRGWKKQTIFSLAKKSRQLFNRGRALPRLAFNFVKSAVYTATPRPLKRLLFYKKHTTPLITRHFNPFLRSLGQFKGYTPTIHGQDILEDLKKKNKDDIEKKIVTIFMPNHVDAIADAILLAHLNLPHQLMFAKPSGFIPFKFVAERFAAEDEFITVGPGSKESSSEKLFRVLDQGKGHYILSFPQGMVSEKSGSPLIPIIPAVESTIIAGLIQKGYKVRIVPITIDVDSSFLKTSDERDYNISMTLGSPLEPTTVEQIIGDGKSNHLGLYLRAHWDHHLNQDDNRHRELSLKEMERRLDTF